MSQDERFVNRDGGMSELVPDGIAKRDENTTSGKERSAANSMDITQSTKSSMEQVQQWVLEALRVAGGTAKLTDIIAILERTKSLSIADRQPQPGHENESTFSYRCRWAVTHLRNQGLLKDDSPRGTIELSDIEKDGQNMTSVHRAANDESALERDPRVWLFQANPKYYRILEALQTLDSLAFLTNRYKDLIGVGDIVLLWMSGKHAGIYAQARVVEGVEPRKSNGPDASFWADTSEKNKIRPRVILAIERRFLGNPLLKTRIAGETGLQGLLILRQPNGTNFRVTKEEWAILQPLLPNHDSSEPDEDVLSWTIRTAHGGKLYEESCGEILERYVAENFEAGREYSRDSITAWIMERYPLFKRITIHCHIEKYTTNYKSRVHYNAGTHHDLLFRENEDWNRLRIYNPGIDPKPIYQTKGSQTTNSGRSDSGRKSWVSKHKQGSNISGSLLERHRRLFSHLAAYGELTSSEEEQLAVSEQDVVAWLDALLVTRSGTRIVSPLFLSLIEQDISPALFITKLVVHFMGHHVERVVNQPLESLEQYVWDRFGSWRLPQPHPGDEKWHGYLALPTGEPADKAASERLDLFSNLPPSVISDLVREPGFLSEQQQWSAQAAGKNNLGILSRQLKLGIRRPLFLSLFRIPELSTGELNVNDLPQSAVLKRVHVVSGLPLCTSDEWNNGIVLEREELIRRLLEHPLYALIVQIEAHRLMASLSGVIAATLRVTPDITCIVEVTGTQCGPLWKMCRMILIDLGFWAIGVSNTDSFWLSAVQVALDNLIAVGVMEMAGGSYRITESFGSDLKAHPNHPQNRGEKIFRARLLQYLEGLQGGIQ